MIISTDTKKDFDKIQHTFIIKTDNIRNGRNEPQHNKGYL
jgi:hypothetical protein